MLIRILVVFTLLSVNSLICASEYTVGIAVWSGYPESVRGFKDGLAELGLVEGEQITFIHGEVGADKTKQKKVAADFNSSGVDLVYSLTTPGTAIVKSIVFEKTPIVFSIVTYPADSGLIDSFEYSGNNLVGTSNYIPLKHYVKLLKVVLPKTKSVAIFRRKGEPNSKIQASSMMRLLKREGIRGIDLEPKNLDQLRQMAEGVAGMVDVFMTTTDTLMQGGGEELLIEISLKRGIPILSSNKSGIEKGSTFGPVADFYTLGKLSGDKAARILKYKIDPTMIESETQNPPLYLVNKRSLKTLGIKLSKKAEEVVQSVK